MLATREEVRKLIENEFSGAKVIFDADESSTHINGTIIWTGFKGKELTERRDLVRKGVRDKLGRRGIYVDTLLPLASEKEL